MVIIGGVRFVFIKQLLVIWYLFQLGCFPCIFRSFRFRDFVLIFTTFCKGRGDFNHRDLISVPQYLKRDAIVLSPVTQISDLKLQGV